MKAHRILKIGTQQWKPAEFAGKNTSGFRPLGDKVLVLCDEAVTKTAGGILLTDAKAEEQSLAAETGVIVEIGEGAFVWNDDRTAPWAGAQPVGGTRVYFEKYAGQRLQGVDGKQYRLMDQRCIAAVETANVEAKAPDALRGAA